MQVVQHERAHFLPTFVGGGSRDTSDCAQLWVLLAGEDNIEVVAEQSSLPPEVTWNVHDS